MLVPSMGLTSFSKTDLVLESSNSPRPKLSIRSSIVGCTFSELMYIRRCLYLCAHAEGCICAGCLGTLYNTRLNLRSWAGMVLGFLV